MPHSSLLIATVSVLILAAGCGSPCIVAGQASGANGSCSCGGSGKALEPDGTCACTLDSQCAGPSHCGNFTCYNLNQPIGKSCTAAIDCSSGICSVAPGMSGRGVCSPPIANGQGNCQLDSDCTSGRCNLASHLCGVIAKDGERCTRDPDCASDICVAQAGLGTCGAVATNHTCFREKDCESSDCVVIYQYPDGHGICGPFPSMGGCIANRDCISGVCTANICS